MLLKKIEIKGFKSFGDKVTIHFGEGITGIVGPNGSGKSNIVDAIRWVLGEQSSKVLRSDKMENVIFNGTKNRKPLQMAEVLMTFQNNKNLLSTEYNEITIGRRYYRAGESEYLLNGVACRLKDIHNLFMDTGISSDSYAIIELKMVDEILNDKDGSRMQLFEEAAGVSKFKIRRKETMRKLEETDADIARIDDLLSEILKNMRQLDRQARQAQQYLELKEQYKKFNMALAKKSIETRNLQISQLEVFLQQENDKKTALDAKIATLVAETESEKLSLLEDEKRISALQKDLNQIIDQIRKKENEINLKNERLKSLNERKKILCDEIQRNQFRADTFKNNLSALESEKNELEGIVETYQIALEEAQIKYQNDKNLAEAERRKLSETQIRLKNSSAELAALIKKNDEIKVQIEIFNNNISAFEKEKEDTIAELAQFSQKIATVNEQIEVLNEQRDNLLELDAQNNRILESLQNEINDLQRQKSLCLGDLEAKRKELAVATALSENLDSYSQAIKYLKSKKEYASLTFLSDAVDCEPQYRAAVEAFLEDKLDYLITRSQSEAFSAISELFQNQKGRAHFLFETPDTQTEQMQLPEGIIAMRSVLKIDPKYTHIVGALFESVFIAENRQPDLEFQGTLVDINGQWIQQGNRLSGGQTSNANVKKIGRFFDLQELKNGIEILESKIEIIEEQIQSKTDEFIHTKNQSFVWQVNELNSRINTLEKELFTLNAQKEQLEIYLRNSETKNREILDKIAVFRDKIAEISPKILALKEETEALEDSVVEIEEKYEKLNRLQTESGAVLNEKSILFNKFNEKLNSLIKEFTYKTKDWNLLKESLQRSRSHLAEVESQIAELAHHINAESANLPNDYAEKSRCESALKTLEQAYFERKNQILGCESQLSKYRSQRDAILQKIAELTDKSNSIKIELVGIRERTAIEFEVDLSDENLAQIKDLDDTEDNLRSQVASIKASLEKAGPINFMAIEAYNEIKERYDFIQSQKNDLLKAKETLTATINEIEAIAKTNFLETFERIRTNFIEIFRSLFAEEDTCDLILSQPDDPLNADIDIIARPKGKKPLTINQLSGGEKALTATALLFAIYLVKPAPFCIFDEVDAPLDDANIDKFSHIIRKFSDRSQFIIVTHNKRTMACTDVMYGITMVDQVSTVVPVDLRVVEK